MEQSISKMCADSLRTFSKEKYDIKLKAAHAHELVAAYFGYTSRNAMLADKNHPISHIGQAEIVVMVPDTFIDQRREKLDELSPGLPDSYTLGEAVYGPLFSVETWASEYPPFRGYKQLAMVLVENNHVYQEQFKYYRDIPVEHYVIINSKEDDTILNVVHASPDPSGEMRGHGQTDINLPRKAGHIGFGKPKMLVGRWSGGARRTLKSLGIQA